MTLIVIIVIVYIYRYIAILSNKFIDLIQADGKNGNGRIEPPEDGWQERIYYCEVPERNSINNDSSRICSKIFGVSPILFLLVFIILKYFKCLIDRKENEENNCSILDIMNSVNIFTAFATFTITFYHYCSGWLEEKCKF